jgi:hypothetical protein
MSCGGRPPHETGPAHLAGGRGLAYLRAGISGLRGHREGAEIMHEPGSMDISQHRTVYGSFIGLVKWGVIACIVLLALMAIFLV